MRPDHEEQILRNPALGACAFWHLSRKYAEYNHGMAPSLPLFIIAAGMLFHNSTVEKVRRMQFDSGILKAVSERPDIIAGLQYRTEQYYPAALKSLQVGTAAGILIRDGGEGFPVFRAYGNDLPKPIREVAIGVQDIFNAAKRLGAWFAAENIKNVCSQLRIEL